METDISELVGKTLKEIRSDVGGGHQDCITFVTEDGGVYCMYHEQSCCEDVYVESTVGDLDDLIGTPVLVAEERSSEATSAYAPIRSSDSSYTWTFYELRTLKGSVTIRWYGTSNGYYSERVSFVRTDTPQSSEGK